MPDQHRLVRSLGSSSLGLGAAMALMPGRAIRLLDIEDDDRSRAWARVVGLRKLAAAAGLLAGRRPAPWLWARAAGDAMDLTLLGAAMRSRAITPNRVLPAMGAVAGVLVIDALAAIDRTRAGAEPLEEQHHVRSAVTVRRPREDVFRLWQDFERLPSFMAHLESVAVIAEGRSHWTATAPGGRKFEWDAEVVESVPGELIAWQSLHGSDVENAGAVRFTTAAGGRGTEIHLDMRYAAPAGPLGEAFATLLGENPGQQVKDDLRRFKQVAETGEIVRSDGTPEGTHSGRLLRQRPAQPLPGGAGDGRR